MEGMVVIELRLISVVNVVLVKSEVIGFFWFLLLIVGVFGWGSF